MTEEICETCKNWEKELNALGYCEKLDQFFTRGFTCGFWEEIETEIEEHCNFCGRSKTEIEAAEGALVGTAGSYICDVCVNNCGKVIGYGQIGLVRKI